MSDPQEILDSLRLDVDQKFFNHFEWVWLKASFDEDGKRNGLTDCCEVEFPCDWHKAIEKANSKEAKA